MVKFIEYTGRWPNLCRGILTLEIDDQIVIFNDSYEKHNKIIDGIEYYDSFWSSGGSCGFYNDYSESYVNCDEWEFEDIRYFPKKYQKYYDEICELFNENVDYGCCGGCL